MAEDKRTALYEVMKGQLALVSLLVFFVGIISTETYYAVFGVKYQFLSLPTFHLIYRGLTMLVEAPYLLLPYLIAILCLVLDEYGVVTVEKLRIPLSYLLVLLLLGLSYPMARYAGRSAGLRDLQEITSTLPRIVNLETKEGETWGMERQYRLLLMDAEFLFIFKPLADNERAAFPNIKRLSKGAVNVLETIP